MTIDFQNLYTAIVYIIFIALLLGSAIFDIKFRIIPNWIVLSIIILGLNLSFLNLEGVDLQSAILGFCAGLLIMMPGYIFAGMGAGDVKLMAAIGTVAGIDKVFDIIIDSIFVMCFISLVFVMVKGDLFKLLLRFKLFIVGLLSGVVYYQRPDSTEAAAQTLPMAPAIMLATLYVLLPTVSHSGLMLILWS